MSETITFKIKFIGTLTRSTFDSSSLDPFEESINDILHWSWSTRRQIERLISSLRLECDGKSKTKIKKRRHCSGTTCDEHLLLIAARNLDRAFDRAPKQLKCVLRSFEIPRIELNLLRNIYEHWDDSRLNSQGDPDVLKGSLKKLRKYFPQAKPWSITINTETGDIKVADILPMLPFLNKLRSLEARMLLLERKLNREKACTKKLLLQTEE